MQDKESDTWRLLSEGCSNVAIVKLRAPEQLDDQTLEGVARTLDQLRVLGLLSVVVLDCGQDATVQHCTKQSFRLCEAIDKFGKPGSKLSADVFTRESKPNSTRPSFLADHLKVDDFGVLEQALHLRLIPVLPPLATLTSGHAPEATSSDDLVLALTRYFSGLQLKSIKSNSINAEDHIEPKSKLASVERIIILDPLGGTPVSTHPDKSHRFINLEQEYEPLTTYLLGGGNHAPGSSSVERSSAAAVHASNLHLAKEALAILPSTSSALITTPAAAANNDKAGATTALAASFVGFDDMVTTRKKQNPLLHNLLTDKPVYSSSLPMQRMQPDAAKTSQEERSTSSSATLVKRGMPLTIYPDPWVEPWRAPKPGCPQLRLTDRCIDLPRLMFLIEDSFNRKIDVQDYLNRVNENLAGVIIAGEYEGGAILTWEKPPGMTEEEAYRTGRMVPYLDKFAVLKSRQGSGGVADIVFNAMVRDCFPEGVCWRSRKDNPVNKWYFERSRGTEVLPDTNWKMFWTTPGFLPGDITHQDYEAVCRGVEPSWADNKHILD